MAALLILLAACSGAQPSVAPTPASPGVPSSGPIPTSISVLGSPSPGVGQIEHPTGATDVVLRLESGGGLLPYGFFATQAPVFTLYGDDSAIFRPTTDSTGTGLPPFIKAVLSAEQVDTLLGFALDEGHLGSAHENYSVADVADGTTTLFTIDAGGVTKVVSAYALGQTTEVSGPQAADYEAFLRLRDLLGNFEHEVSLGNVMASATYVPLTYRAVLLDSAGTSAALAWPWPDLSLTDFQPNAASSTQRLAAITPDQAARVTALPSGGVGGIAILSPDGRTRFSLSLRPLLPGDALQPDSDPSLRH